MSYLELQAEIRRAQRAEAERAAHPVTIAPGEVVSYPSCWDRLVLHVIGGLLRLTSTRTRTRIRANLPGGTL